MLIQDYLIKGRDFFDANRSANTLARLEFFNEGSSENRTEIKDFPAGSIILYPEWYKRDNGQGTIIQFREKNEMCFKINVHGSGKIKILLRGEFKKVPDKEDLLPISCIYTDLIINNKKLLDKYEKATYDKPVILTIDGTDGEELEVYVKWLTQA